MSETCKKCGLPMETRHGWSFCDGHPHKVDGVECLTAQLRERDEQLAAVKAVILAAWEHVNELRDAWARGAIREHDGKGGTRSNRNVDVEVSFLRRKKGSEDGEG